MTIRDFIEPYKDVYDWCKVIAKDTHQSIFDGYMKVLSDLHFFLDYVITNWEVRVEDNLNVFTLYVENEM